MIQVIPPRNTDYWISQRALTFSENDLDDPNRVAVSLVAGSVIMVYKEGVIDYDTSGEYRKWVLKGYSTKLVSNKAHNVYARLSRDSNDALIVFSVNDYDVDGSILGEGGEPSSQYWYIEIGELTGTDGVIKRTLTYDSGLLGTKKGEKAETKLEEMFELSKTSTPWMIIVKQFFYEFTVKNPITLLSGLIFDKGDGTQKYIKDIKRSTDGDDEVPISDETIPTTKFVQEMNDDRYLSKVHDDSTPHSIGVGKNLTVGGNADIGGHVTTGGDLTHKGFSKDTEGGAYSIHQNEDGHWEAEADILVARIMARVYDLFVKHNAKFVGDLTSAEFVSGFLSGKGWGIRVREFINASGITEYKSVAEFDDVVVRGSMRVYEFIISQLLGENDNRVFTGMMEVDHYDAESGKIYMKTGNGKMYNPFREDDVIVVQQYGGMPSEQNGHYVTKQYELIVTGVGVGEIGKEDRLDWITFRNFTTTIEGGDESLIQEGDTLVRMDNLTENNRKGIVQIISVGEDTPYIDFLWGAKTDPENCLKGRMGNLGGIYNPLFGNINGFGAYLQNLYAVGEFKIAHTGEDVADAIEMAKASFRTNFRQFSYDITEEDNFFYNASFTDDCEGWILAEEGTEYFLVEGLPQYFNYELYASEKTYAGIDNYDDRDMLRVFSSSARQENGLIRKPSTHKVYGVPVLNEDGTFESPYTEEPDMLYLNIRMYCHADGEMEVGFMDAEGVYYDNIFHKKEAYAADIDAYYISVAGTWDGLGDFYIRTTGDFYIDRLSLTDKPLDNFKITTSTAIEQDAQRIALLGKKVSGIDGSVTNLGIELDSMEETITSYVDKEIEGVNKTLSEVKLSVDGISATVEKIEFDDDGNIKNVDKTGLLLEKDFADLFATEVNAQGLATTAEIKLYVDELVSNIEITADNIKLEGNDLIEIINKGTTSIVADRININGAISANQTFRIDENGYLNCSGGRIANFMIVGNDLENFTNDARIIISNDNDSAVASKKAEIGLSTVLVTGTSGLHAMGLFVDEEVGDASNIALAVSAKNASTNIGLLMMGGCIAGLAEKVGHYMSNGSTITREDNVAIAYGARIYLPEMNDYDDGHIVTVISNYTSSSSIDCSGKNFIRNGNNRVVSISVDALSCMRFVYVANWTHKFPIDEGEDEFHKGCWVKI